MLGKYIELDHNLNQRKVKNYKKEPISTILHEIGERKTEAAVETAIGSVQLVHRLQHNWGFLDTILTCYSNHWILKTSPEDWRNIIGYTVATAIDQKSNLSSIRKFFVNHNGKKQIKIRVKSFADLDYSWLFTQFTQQIAANVNHPGYVKLIEADFTTTSHQQLIISQIMVMASLQEYFECTLCTECGIPGVEMTGAEEDWKKMVTKLEDLRKLLQPIIEDLELTAWFSKTKKILDNLVETYNGVPNKVWWSHILSHILPNQSGERSYWTGWMAEFLRPDTNTPEDFPSGVVSLPLMLKNNTDLGFCVEDTGILVAGTAGYSLDETTYDRPSVKSEHGWGLLIPKHSPITAIINGSINY